MAGAGGRMGRRIMELAMADGLEIAAGLERRELAGTTVTIGAESGRAVSLVLSSDPLEALLKADVLIDFSSPAAAVANVHAAAELEKPAVVGTTGLSDAQASDIAASAHMVPVVFAPNTSVGVNLLFKLASEVAGVLGLDYNVEIVETHHRLKKDSPSGTAKRLAECVAESLGMNYNDHVKHGREGIVGERPQVEIGMHAVRGGDVVGDHTVYFIGQGERIELTHRAHNRDTFAKGALRAAQFALAAKPGLYDMQDVLGLR